MWHGALRPPWSNQPWSSSLDWQWSARKLFCDASFLMVETIVCVVVLMVWLLLWPSQRKP